VEARCKSIDLHSWTEGAPNTNFENERNSLEEVEQLLAGSF